MSECRLITLICAQTFNHGVEGSSPSALTKEINNLTGFAAGSKMPRVGTVLANRLPRAGKWKQGATAMPIDDPATWSQGALAFKTIFDGLRSAISMVREARGKSGDADHGKEETKLIEAALEKASTATAVAEAEVAKALGFELCKCQFPPIPMLTVGRIDIPDLKMRGPVYECPKCGYNSAGPWGYNRIAPPRATEPAPS